MGGRVATGRGGQAGREVGGGGVPCGRARSCCPARRQAGGCGEQVLSPLPQRAHRPCGPLTQAGEELHVQHRAVRLKQLLHLLHLQESRGAHRGRGGVGWVGVGGIQQSRLEARM